MPESIPNYLLHLVLLLFQVQLLNHICDISLPLCAHWRIVESTLLLKWVKVTVTNLKIWPGSAWRDSDNKLASRMSGWMSGKKVRLKVKLTFFDTLISSTWQFFCLRPHIHIWEGMGKYSGWGLHPTWSSTKNHCDMWWFGMDQTTFWI